MLQDKSERFITVQELIKRMPIEHRETLRHLLKHLTKVVELSDQNRMTLKNVAVLFGPNIMRSDSINDIADGYNPLMVQNIIAEYLLINYKELYSFPPNWILNEIDQLIS